MTGLRLKLRDEEIAASKDGKTGLQYSRVGMRYYLCYRIRPEWYSPPTRRATADIEICYGLYLSVRSTVASCLFRTATIQSASYKVLSESMCWYTANDGAFDASIGRREGEEG